MKKWLSLLALGILSSGNAFAISRDLADRVVSFYENSACARKTVKESGNDQEEVKSSLRLLLEDKKENSNAEAVYFMLHTVQGSSFTLEMNCLPPLNTIAPFTAWVEMLKGKELISLGAKESAANRIVESLVSELSQQNDMKNLGAKKELIEYLRPLYAEFQVRVSLVRLFDFLDDSQANSQALNQASKLGDPQAVTKAQEAVNKFLEGKYDDREAFEAAVRALEISTVKDPSVVSSKKATLKEVVESEVTPTDVKAAVEDGTIAN